VLHDQVVACCGERGQAAGGSRRRIAAAACTMGQPGETAPTAIGTIDTE
jgi:hypothetical protein